MPSWKKVITSGSNASLAQISASIVPTVTGNENLLAYDSTTGGITQITQVHAGDNLGNHTATQTLDLGNNAISNALTLNTLTVGTGGESTTNTVVGYQALSSVTSAGFYNTAVGYQSLNANTIGKNNTAVGYQALMSNIGGLRNTAIGYDSLQDNIEGDSNIALGYRPLNANTTGNNNIAMGYEPLNNNNADSNIALGHQTLYNNISGHHNIALGYRSLFSNTSGLNNVALGYKALHDNTDGDSNTAIGNQALYENIGGYRNIAIGYHSLHENTIGNQNIALGFTSLFENTTGDRNIALGDSALYENISGENNIAIGADALRNNSTGDNNTAIGHEAGKFLANGSSINSTAYSNIFIGKDTRNDTYVDGQDIYPNYNTIVIGNEAVSVGKNSVVLGNDSIELTALKGKIGIGTTTPMNSLQIDHSGGDGNQGIMIVRADIATTSDEILGGIGFDSTDGNVPSSILEASAYIAAFASETHSTGDKGGELAFGTAALNENHDTVSNEVMRLTDGGDVGIGDTTPTRRLSVIKNDASNHIALFQNLNTSDPEGIRIRCEKNDNEASYIQFDRDGGNPIGSVTGDGDNTISYNESSDARLKNNIRDCEFTIDDFEKVKIRSYEKSSDRTHHGVIAQELLDTKFAELVRIGEKENAKTGLKPGEDGYQYMEVAYNKFIPVLVKSVQDANKMIKELEERIRVLES